LIEAELDLKEWMELAVLFISQQDIEGYLKPRDQEERSGWYPDLKEAFYSRLPQAKERSLKSGNFYGLAGYFFDEERWPELRRAGDWTTFFGRTFVETRDLMVPDSTGTQEGVKEEGI
jgi:hypothetical protein